MPFCPKCQYEYEEGVAECPDCNAKLVAELPPDDHIDEDLAPVFLAKDEAEARIVRAILEEAGIPVWEKEEFVRDVVPYPVDPVPDSALMVPQSRVEEAKGVIEKALEDGKRMPAETEV